MRRPIWTQIAVKENRLYQTIQAARRSPSCVLGKRSRCQKHRKHGKPRQNVEESIETDGGSKQGAAENTDHERGTDRNAGNRECLGPNAWPGNIGKRGQGDGADCAGSLDGPRDNQLRDILRHTAADASQREQSESQDEHRLSSPPIARPAERNLKNALCQRVNAKSDSSQRYRCAGIAHDVGAKIGESEIFRAGAAPRLNSRR